MNRPIRILIADNDIEFAQNLRLFLDQQEDMRVIELIRDGPGIVQACKEALPDLILMDLHLPILDSIKAIRLIVGQNERIRIVGISATHGDRYAVEAIKAGAHGYIEKNGYQVIAEAVRMVAMGEVLVNPSLASSILDEFHRLAC